MRPNQSFLNKSNEFWAIVRYSSSLLGYSDRNTHFMKRYTLDSLNAVTSKFRINNNLINEVLNYLNYRAALLDNQIEPFLMNKEQAKSIYEEMISNYKPQCSLPNNKQKGDKRHPNYFTCIINIITEKTLTLNRRFVDEARKLCIITDQNNRPIMTLSRRMDGAYPDFANPIAVWEIKEYYGTNTFGSRVADGVYETLLDGYELLKAVESFGRRIEHYLFVDDRFTWWECGKSYLCRLIDSMHMDLVDEVIFGKEVLTRWPEIVSLWP